MLSSVEAAGETDIVNAESDAWQLNILFGRLFSLEALKTHSGVNWI